MMSLKNLVSDLGEFTVYYAVCAVPVLMFKHDVDPTVRIVSAILVFCVFGAAFVLFKSFRRKQEGS